MAGSDSMSISIMDRSITDRSNFNLIEELFFHFGVEVLL